MICLLQWMIVPVYAADIEFTECSKLMQATVKVDATEQPDINSAVITTFEQGAPMLVTGESQSGWYRITFQGKDGYVKMDAVEAAVQVEGESLEELDRELDELEQTNKVIVEEVERMRAEKQRSSIWTVVIIALVAGIFGVGIYSTIKANREERESDADSEMTLKKKYDEEEISEINLPNKISMEEKRMDIIDLDSTDIDDVK